MKNETLDPVEIEKLTWLTTRQACIYLKMYPMALSNFIKEHNIPFRKTAAATNSRRIFQRATLDRAMRADMEHTNPLSDAAGSRVATIVGEA